MKRTRNMYYEESPEAWELREFIARNNEYDDVYISITKNSYKKMQRGTYSFNESINAFYDFTNLAANLYFKKYGVKFNTQQKYTVAVLLALEWESVAEEETCPEDME